jgi:hypothetical protein
MKDIVFEGNIKLTTVEQARDWLRARVFGESVRAKQGARCPCCKQYVKIYKRPLGAPMARWLIWLVRTWQHKFHLKNLKTANNDAWIDIRLAPVRGGDYAKLLHWGLIEHKLDVVKKDNGAKDTKDSGYWRPTFKGIDFVKGALKVPSHVYLYDNIKIGEEERLITIMEALGKKFSYEELMNADIDVKVPGL